LLVGVEPDQLEAELGKADAVGKSALFPPEREQIFGAFSGSMTACA
jgi:hypothetical protein